MRDLFQRLYLGVDKDNRTRMFEFLEVVTPYMFVNAKQDKFSRRKVYDRIRAVEGHEEWKRLAMDLHLSINDTEGHPYQNSVTLSKFTKVMGYKCDILVSDEVSRFYLGLYNYPSIYHTLMLWGVDVFDVRVWKELSKEFDWDEELDKETVPSIRHSVVKRSEDIASPLGKQHTQPSWTEAHRGMNKWERISKLNWRYRFFAASCGWKYHEYVPLRLDSLMLAREVIDTIRYRGIEEIGLAFKDPMTSKLARMMLLICMEYNIEDGTYGPKRFVRNSIEDSLCLIEAKDKRIIPVWVKSQDIPKYKDSIIRTYPQFPTYRHVLNHYYSKLNHTNRHNNNKR